MVKSLKKKLMMQCNAIKAWHWLGPSTFLHVETKEGFLAGLKNKLELIGTCAEQCLLAKKKASLIRCSKISNINWQSNYSRITFPFSTFAVCTSSCFFGVPMWKLRMSKASFCKFEQIFRLLKFRNANFDSLVPFLGLNQSLGEK